MYHHPEQTVNQFENTPGGSDATQAITDGNPRYDTFMPKPASLPFAGHAVSN